MESTESNFVAEIAAEIPEELGAPSSETTETSSASSETPAPAASVAQEQPPQGGDSRESDRRQHIVPQAALVDMRRRMQENERVLQARIAALEAAMAPKPVPMPDPETEPLAFLNWQKEQVRQQTEERQTRAQAEAAARQQQEWTQQVIDLYAEAADDAREVAPDWDDAYGHLVAWGDKELRRQGYRNPRERAAMLQKFELELVEGSLRSGLNPAQVIYNKAFEHGYAGQRVSAPAPQMPQFQAAQVGQAPARDPATGQFKPAKAPPKSLSHAAGAPGGQITAESIASMPDAEFDKLFREDKWRGLHGK